MGKQQKSSKIDPNDMVALWSYDGDGRITEFLIVSEKDYSQELYAEYHSSWGKGTKDWGLRGFCNKPAGLFAYLATARGFASDVVARRVLTQFAGVKRQRWAKSTKEWLDHPE